jgi:hypothetical protein
MSTKSRESAFGGGRESEEITRIWEALAIMMISQFARVTKSSGSDCSKAYRRGA